MTGHVTMSHVRMVDHDGMFALTRALRARRARPPEVALQPRAQRA